MFILRDEKLIKKISDYDKTFNQNDYVFACIEGGLNKSNTTIMWVIISILAVVTFVFNDTIIWYAIIGGLIGGTAALSNDFCVIVADDKQLNLYLFNKLMSKVKSKIEFPYNAIEIEEIKKTSIFSAIKIKTKEREIKLAISEKTIRLKKQTENVKRLTEKLNHIILQK